MRREIRLADQAAAELPRLRVPVRHGRGRSAWSTPGEESGVTNTPVRVITPRGEEEAWARLRGREHGAGARARSKYTFLAAVPAAASSMSSPKLPMYTGAMENPGLVTFRQSLILCEAPAAEIDRRSCRAYASVCAHELAHQWFRRSRDDDAWWDDLWLNEKAFATWMTPKIMERVPAGVGRSERGVPIRRTARCPGRTVWSARGRSVSRSSRKTSIRNAFDGITYQKGAAVIGMFERWMGADAFQKDWVRRYMEGARGRGGDGAGVSRGDFTAEAGKDVVAGVFDVPRSKAGVPLVHWRAEVLSASGPPAAPDAGAVSAGGLRRGRVGDVTRRGRFRFACAMAAGTRNRGRACSSIRRTGDIDPRRCGEPAKRRTRPAPSGSC